MSENISKCKKFLYLIKKNQILVLVNVARPEALIEKSSNTNINSAIAWNLDPRVCFNV